jgi:hypothetical protein
LRAPSLAAWQQVHEPNRRGETASCPFWHPRRGKHFHGIVDTTANQLNLVASSG